MKTFLMIVPYIATLVQIVLASHGAYILGPSVVVQEYRRRYFWLMTAALITLVCPLLSVPRVVISGVQIIVIYLSARSMGKYPMSHYRFLDRFLLVITVMAILIILAPLV